MVRLETYTLFYLVLLLQNLHSSMVRLERHELKPFSCDFENLHSSMVRLERRKAPRKLFAVMIFTFQYG